MQPSCLLFLISPLDRYASTRQTRRKSRNSSTCRQLNPTGTYASRPTVHFHPDHHESVRFQLELERNVRSACSGLLGISTLFNGELARIGNLSVRIMMPDIDVAESLKSRTRFSTGVKATP